MIYSPLLTSSSTRSATSFNSFFLLPFNVLVKLNLIDSQLMLNMGSSVGRQTFSSFMHVSILVDIVDFFLISYMQWQAGVSNV
ncbi:hypothetical protein BLOT_005877 [Blomia tropicalis]|nr:hypothetical protein BLOT_005877 [Blomia tropicalis]